MSNVIYIGCDLYNQCRNYKIECGNCSQNEELEWDVREECDDFSDDCNEDCDEDCNNCDSIDNCEFWVSDLVYDEQEF